MSSRVIPVRILREKRLFECLPVLGYNGRHRVGESRIMPALVFPPPVWWLWVPRPGVRPGSPSNTRTGLFLDGDGVRLGLREPLRERDVYGLWIVVGCSYYPPFLFNHHVLRQNVSNVCSMVDPPSVGDGSVMVTVMGESSMSV